MIWDWVRLVGVVLIIFGVVSCGGTETLKESPKKIAANSTMPVAQSITLDVTETPQPTLPPSPVSTATATSQPTPEPTATLTPFQVWEATCLAEEGVQYVDVLFGPQPDGGYVGVNEIINGSKFLPEAIPDCYMLENAGKGFTSPNTLTRAVGWQIHPLKDDLNEAPGFIEARELTPEASYPIMLKTRGGNIEHVMVEPTVDPHFALVSPFAPCNGDNDPTMYIDGDMNGLFSLSCAQSGYGDQIVGHTDHLPPRECLISGERAIVEAPATGTLTPYDCGSLTGTPCYHLAIDNPQYLNGLDTALEFVGIQNVDHAISQIMPGDLIIDLGDVKKYEGIGTRVEAGQPIGTVNTGLDQFRLPIHIFYTNSNWQQYQISITLFPLADGEWTPMDKSLPVYRELNGGTPDELIGGPPKPNRCIN